MAGKDGSTVVLAVGGAAAVTWWLLKGAQAKQPAGAAITAAGANAGTTPRKGATDPATEGPSPTDPQRGAIAIPTATSAFSEHFGRVVRPALGFVEGGLVNVPRAGGGALTVRFVRYDAASRGALWVPADGKGGSRLIPWDTQPSAVEWGRKAPTRADIQRIDLTGVFTGDPTYGWGDLKGWLGGLFGGK